MIIHKSQDEVFLLFLINQVAISFIIPNHWLDVIHIEVHCDPLASYDVPSLENKGRHTPELVLQSKSSKKRRHEDQIFLPGQYLLFIRFLVFLG
jgi:hypothetical protein